MKITLIIISFSFCCLSAHGTLGQTMYLTQIAGTVAKDLQVTLELFEIAKDEQERLEAIHRDIRTKQMLARRVQRQMEQAQRLSNLNVESHSDFNRALKNIKWQANRSERLLEDLGDQFVKNQEEQAFQDIKREEVENARSEAEYHVRASYTDSDPEKAQVNTAASSAFNSAMLADLNENLIEQNSILLRQEERVLEEEIYRQNQQKELFDWMGVSREREIWTEMMGETLD